MTDEVAAVFSGATLFPATELGGVHASYHEALGSAVLMPLWESQSVITDNWDKHDIIWPLHPAGIFECYSKLRKQLEQF